MNSRFIALYSHGSHALGSHRPHRTLFTSVFTKSQGVAGRGQGASQIHLVLQYSRSSKYSGVIVKDQAISVDDIVYDDQKLKEKATELVRGFWGSK